MFNKTFIAITEVTPDCFHNNIKINAAKNSFKMGRDSCCVLTCGKEPDTNEGIKLHYPPKDVFVADLYQRFLKRSNKDYPSWKPPKRLCVCSDHFSFDAFVENEAHNKRKLKSGKYPTIFAGKDISHDIVSMTGAEIISFALPPAVVTGLPFQPSSLKMFTSSSSSSDIGSELAINQNVPLCRPAFKLVDQFQAEPLRHRISELESHVKMLLTERNTLEVQRTNDQIEIRTLQKRVSLLESRLAEAAKTNHVLKQQNGQNEKRNKRLRDEVDSLVSDAKRLKLITCTTASQTEVPSNSKLQTLFHGLTIRQENCKNFPYTDLIREFAFTLHYLSPSGYGYVRNFLEKLLPHACTLQRWTSFVDPSPGLIEVSLNDIAKTNKATQKYYTVSIDEFALRKQILFNGQTMVGYVDGGGIVEVRNPSDYAKNAFFCLATEINGHKSIPICYTLTRGLTADDVVAVLTKCLTAMDKAGAIVVSIAFDGLPTNFTAMKRLGANLELESDNFQPYILHPSTGEKVYLMPDCSHMFKILRNNFKACQILKNGEDKYINWGYIAMLEEVQKASGVRAGNKLTCRHVNFERQKMRTKLCAQALSSSVSAAITFCRKIEVDGFSDSEATSEFLEICDKLFDLLNSKARGVGSKAPLRNANAHEWEPFLTNFKQYLLSLQCKAKGKEGYHKMYETNRGTFVRGLVISISSVELIMKDLAAGKIKLTYVPFYRSSQDPLELLFGKFRARLGFNNNPNVLQLQQSLKGILCYSIHASVTGNCVEQDTFCNTISPTQSLQSLLFEAGSEDADDTEDRSNDKHDLPSFNEMSLFVENVVVYVSGFTGRELLKSLKCEICNLELMPADVEGMKLRSDYVLLNTKDRGGLFCPSEDLIKVCKVAESQIRMSQALGVSTIDSKKIQHAVIQNCLECAFPMSHVDHSNAPISPYERTIGHKADLIREISKSYIKIRLHYVAKSTTLAMCPETKRTFHNKLCHFSGY